MNTILNSAFVQMKQSYCRPMFRFCIFFNPILLGLLLGMMYQDRSSEEFMQYAIIGTGMSTFWSSICFSSASDITREKWMGTLPNLFIAPSGFIKIVFGKILGNTLWGIFSFVLSISFVYLIFDSSFVIRHRLLFSFVLMMTIISMVSIAFMLCALFTLSRKAQLLMNFIEYPIMILTGMVFPLASLPKFMYYFSYLMSPTWSMLGFSLSINGGEKTSILKVCIVLLCITISYFISGYFLFKHIEKMTRIHGTLEVF